MLLNYTDTLDDVFTLAHEMGHSMHTILSHETQPFVYSGYTIFVAEVPSTLSEALLLEYMLERSTDPDERIVLLQHAIDNITGTFYTQVMFADFELRAHRLAEQDQPITAEILTEIYTTLLKDYYGDAIDMNPLTRHHLGAHPALLQLAVLRLPVRDLLRVGGAAGARDHAGRRERRRGARALPRRCCKSGGNDYPMEQLKKAGVDLAQPDTVRGRHRAAGRSGHAPGAARLAAAAGYGGHCSIGSSQHESGATEPSVSHDLRSPCRVPPFRRLRDSVFRGDVQARRQHRGADERERG